MWLSNFLGQNDAATVTRDRQDRCTPSEASEAFHNIAALYKCKYPKKTPESTKDPVFSVTQKEKLCLWCWDETTKDPQVTSKPKNQ